MRPEVNAAATVARPGAPAAASLPPPGFINGHVSGEWPFRWLIDSEIPRGILIFRCGT